MRYNIEGWALWNKSFAIPQGGHNRGWNADDADDAGFAALYPCRCLSPPSAAQNPRYPRHPRHPRSISKSGMANVFSLKRLCHEQYKNNPDPVLSPPMLLAGPDTQRQF